MSSQAQVLANRRNAEKSTGPRTPEGKAVVAQNAVKHGLLARQAVLRDEDPQEFELHRTRMLQSLDPDGPEQEMLAERIVGLWWRLKRAERMQDEALDYLIEADRGSDWVKHLRSQGDPSAGVELTFGRAVARDFADARTLDRLSMHERRIESSLYRMMGELRKLKLARESGTPVETQHLASHQQIAPDDFCCAKQSQSAAEMSSLKCDVSSEAGAVPADSPSRETKPIEPAGTIRTLPVTPDHGRDAHATPTPYGVTASGVERAKQSQIVPPVEGGDNPPREPAKQSQRLAAGARAVLRPRPRVAYHVHNIVRSY